MDTYEEITARVRGGASDTARRLMKAQEDMLGALEEYQATVAKEARTPWAAAKVNTGFWKQLADIQTDLAQDLTSGFARPSQPGSTRTNKSGASS
jgi:glycerol kinase